MRINPFKPWYLFRPQQVLHRLTAWRLPPGIQPLSTSWGGLIYADPSKAIGRGIANTGIYDLGVSELVVRLAAPGATIIDAGANVGYVTQLAALCVGTRGRVLAFEPNPALFQTLKLNCTRRGGRGCLPTLHFEALGAECGVLSFAPPLDSEHNDGVGRIVGQAASNTVQVPSTTIDTALGNATAQLMKVDVEGYELSVLQGSTRALGEKRIRNIVFEDHDVTTSPVLPLLKRFGYEVFSVGWTLTGLAIVPIERGAHEAPFEAPNFLATLNSHKWTRGWRCLRRIPNRT